MKRFLSLASALFLGSLVLSGCQAEKKAGTLQPGDDIGAFTVLKVAGASDDGVDVGSKLCYRCKYGKKPMVMVFVRGNTPELAAAVKELDKVVADDKKVFVNILGASQEAAEKDAKALATAVADTKMPIVVPVDVTTGPTNYGLVPTDQVTVIVAAEGKVKAKHSKLDDATLKTIVSELNTPAGS